MAAIQMNAGNGVTGNVTLPAPSTATVALVNGVGTVQAVDVPTAIQAGWQVCAGQPWPASKVFHMTIPSVGAWPSSGSVTFPDGSTATITGGVALIPIAWLNWARGLGWSATPGFGNEGI